MYRHTHRARSHSVRQLPYQPTARVSRCEWVFDASVPGPEGTVLLKGRGCTGGHVGGVGQKPLSGGSEGQELEL